MTLRGTDYSGFSNLNHRPENLENQGRGRYREVNEVVTEEDTEAEDMDGQSRKLAGQVN